LYSKGVTFGADQRVSSEVVLGVALGLAHERADTAGDAISDGADAVSTTVYLGYRPSGALSIDALAGLGELQVRSARRLGERSIVSAARPASQRFASVAAGYRRDVTGADVAPYTRVDAPTRRCVPTARPTLASMPSSSSARACRR
jgi:hypothetical protein